MQGLRAAAAFSVAFTHITHDAIKNGTDPSGWLESIDAFLPWSAGVDIFFVISGFVIVHASDSLFGAGASSLGVFLRRRLTRIVPLYWIMTALFLAVLLVSRKAIHGDIGGPAYIGASFLFIPWPRPDGLMQPAFGLGWTLNYEMFFYAVFAPFLFFRRNTAVLAATMVFCVFVALGQFFHFTNLQLGYWSSPIILEFCAGMVLAQILAAGVTLPLAARIILPAVAIVIMHFTNGAAEAFRPLAFGIPAFMLVAAATLAPVPPTLSRGGRLLVRLGDASYALYLVHPFIMRGLSMSWHRIHAHNEFAGIIYVAAGLALAQVCALAINSGLERRLSILPRRRSGVQNEVIQIPGIRPDGLL